MVVSGLFAGIINDFGIVLAEEKNCELWKPEKTVELLQQKELFLNVIFEDKTELMFRIAFEAAQVVGIGIKFKIEEITEGLGNYEAVIEEVVKNSPADKAGLKKGDSILLINSDSIPKDHFELINKIIGDGKPGNIIKLDIFRNDRVYQINIKTVVLREDKTEEAKLLFYKVFDEAQDFSKKTEIIFTGAAGAFKDCAASGDTRFMALAKLVEDYKEWYKNRSSETDKLLEIKLE